MVTWLNDHEMRAWRSLFEVYADVDAGLETELTARHGLNLGEYAVLGALSEAPALRLRMCDLAHSLHLSPSGLTRRVDGMVRRGLVLREPSPDDRRVILAVMTPAGMRALEGAAPDHAAGIRRELLDHLTTTQIRQLGAALAAVQRGRQKMSPAPQEHPGP